MIINNVELSEEQTKILTKTLGQVNYKNYICDYASDYALEIIFSILAVGKMPKNHKEMFDIMKEENEE